MKKTLIHLLLSVTLVLCGRLPKKYTIDSYLENPAVKNFIEYVKIDTSKEENLEQAVDFWSRKATEVGLEMQTYYPAGLPVCVLTWPGTEPGLPSIMLNSHMDVVRVEEDEWTYPPFSGHMDDNGNIYGRGTQDDKDVAILYLEAIRRMKQEGVRLNRTLHITLVSDEEAGGFRGMLPFIQTEAFKQLNVGFALDEGLVSSDDQLFATYVDKRPWQMNITVHGASGHGSSVKESTAMEKMRKLIDIISDYRDEQKRIAATRDAVFDYGAYDSVNINILTGGIANNVLPSKMSLIVDMRLATTTNITDASNRVSSWLAEAGNGTEISFIRQVLVAEPIPVDNSNPYWVAMKGAIEEMGHRVKPVVCPATSDMVPIRNRGFPAIGFAFKPYTSSRVHASNEYLNVDNLLRGIDVYVNVLTKLGNV